MSLMSELIKQLRNEADGIRSNIDMDFPVSIGQAKLYEEAADVIEELSAKLHAANMERSSMCYNGGWIPVSERLPENRKLVLVTAYWHETYQVMQASYFGDGVWWCVPFNNTGKHEQKLKAKAWMPLPNPYKESEDINVRNQV